MEVYYAWVEIVQVHIFRECEPAFLLAIYPKLVIMRCAPGEVLTTEGAIGLEMYFILSGTVLVMVSAGKMRVLWRAINDFFPNRPIGGEWNQGGG